MDLEAYKRICSFRSLARRLGRVPSRYLEMLGGTKAHAEEARAAVKPFEDAIFQELRRVEAALRKAMSTEDASRDAGVLLALTVTKAHHVIGHVRYENNRSLENIGEVALWITHLAPLAATE
jgi:hypothetical protein